MERAPNPHKGTVARRGVLSFIHAVTIGASGAISSQDGDSGVVAAKQATAGQYTLTFPKAFKKLVNCSATFEGTIGATSTGSQLSVLTNNLTKGTKSGVLTVQWTNNSANAAADVPSGVVLTYYIDVEVGI
jgi:hypothetical protein